MQTKVNCSALQKGMFVSSLDRPWIDTPFILQGFLIESDSDIKYLTQYCEFVYIDWNMSTIQVPFAYLQATDFNLPLTLDSSLATRIPVIDPSQYNDLATFSPDQLRDSTHASIQSETIAKPASLTSTGIFSGIADKLLSIFVNPKTPTGDSRASHNLSNNLALTIPQHFDFIPPDISLFTYINDQPIHIEIEPAVSAHKHASEVLDELVKNIQGNKHFSVKQTTEVVNDIVGSMVRNPDAMMWITRLRNNDEVVYGHSLQVAVYLVALGRHLGLPKELLERLCTMGLLLDIGKIKLPKSILLKKGRLTPEEFEIVKSHVNISLTLLQDTPDLHPDVLQGISQHHERENGSGYPAGLFKSEISLFGRMTAITDSFAALTNPRTYAETMPAYEALKTLSNFNSDLYQSSMIEQFIQAIGVFPVGSMVELSSGEVAVVIGHSKVRRLKPKVLIIGDAKKRPLTQPVTLDLLYQSQEINTDLITIQRGLPAGAFGLDAREYYLS